MTTEYGHGQMGQGTGVMLRVSGREIRLDVLYVPPTFNCFVFPSVHIHRHLATA